MSVMGSVQILPLVLTVSLLYKELLLASNETPVKKEKCNRLTLIMQNVLRGEEYSRAAAVLDIFRRRWMLELDAVEQFMALNNFLENRALFSAVLSNLHQAFDADNYGESLCQSRSLQ